MDCSRFVAVALALACVPACRSAGGTERGAYWSFETLAAGIVADAGGGGHDLTVTGGALVAGAMGNGLLFRGGETLVQGALSEALQSPAAVTLEAWVRPDAASPESEGIGIINAGNYLLRLTRGTPSFHVFTDRWGPVLAAGGVRPGAWYHLAGTYDGEEMRIYVNGALSASEPRSGTIARSAAGLLLGRQANPFVGVIDEARIVLRRLSEAEIASAYEAGLARLNPGVEPGALRHPFDEVFGPAADTPAPLATLAHLPPSEVTFALVADTHIGGPGEEHQYCRNWRVAEVIRQINALPVDFVVHGGDIVTAFPHHETFEAQCRNARAMLGELRAPLHLVPGNHDIGNQRSLAGLWDQTWAERSGAPAEAMLFSAGHREVYRKHFGGDTFSLSLGGSRFIGINTQVFDSGGELEIEQMGWIEGELRRSTGAGPTIVFGHMPLFWNRPDEPGPPNYDVLTRPARQRLLDLFAAHGVAVYFSGHTHVGFANAWRGVRLCTVGSTTFNRTFPGIGPSLSGSARIYDPHPLGFLVVRVRAGEVHASWVPTVRQVPEPPAALAGLAGARPVGRPAAEVGGSVLAVRAAIPLPFVTHHGEREGRNDAEWRLAEQVGCPWLQVWPPPGPREDWEALTGLLSHAPPQGVRIALPLPGFPAAIAAACARLAPHWDAIAAVLVANGLPMAPTAPLASWRSIGDPADWVAACRQARGLVGPRTQVLLARLPLLGDGAIEAIAAAALGLRGHADGLCVWAAPEAMPEATLEPALDRALAAVRAQGLELWLDVEGWRAVPDLTRNAFLLRLLALCQERGVRLTWWPGVGAAGGLLDQHHDPTHAFHALQAWLAVVDAGAPSPVAASANGVRSRTWTDRLGRRHAVWWRPDGDLDALGEMDAPLPGEALLVDPLHARVLRSPVPGRVPVCAWPLLARLPATSQ